MSRKIVFMFSGQGSQYFNMGKEIYESNETFKKWMDKLDHIAKSIIGQSVLGKVYQADKKKSESFDETLFSHPAIFMFEYALAKVLIEKNIEPDYLLGSSLGEFTSIALAESMSLEDVMLAVVKQAQVLDKNCLPGSMIAIIDNVRLYYDNNELFNNSDLISVNYDSHFVISGDDNKLKEVKKYLKNKKIIHQVLPVSHGFHSYSIEKAQTEYLKILSSFKYLKPKIPIISSVEAKQINNIPNDYLWNIVRKPIRFSDAIRSIDNNELVYLDLGPSGTLSNFIKYILSSNTQSISYSLFTPMSKEINNLNKLKEYSKKSNKKKGMKMVTYVFPGQGSQKKGMGKEVFDKYPELVSKADEILGYSIKELCLEDKEGLLANTKYTQPALFTVSVLSYLDKIATTNVKPDFVAGHSLGEYSALFAAGIIDFETGLKLVKARGEIMSQAKGGGMAAVIGLSEEQVSDVISKNKLDSIDVANYNSPFQIVISGPKKDIEDAKKHFEAAKAKMYVVLKVSGAFHSRYMEEARKSFESVLNDAKFNKIEIPIISNVTARPYKESEIKKNLLEQITHSVKWTESVRYLMSKPEMKYEEIGVGNVLTGLIAKITKEATPLEITEQVKEKKAEEKKSEKKVKNTNKSSEESTMIKPESLGCEEYKKDYNIKYAYATGAMFRGVASKELVVKIGKAGLIGFMGTGGLSLTQIEESINYIQKELSNNQSYGMNLLCNLIDPQMEEDTVDLFMKYNVKNIEAAAYMQITPALVKYRLNGLSKSNDGKIIAENKIQAKVSRPEVATAFLSPAPERVVNKLLEQNKITKEQADLSKEISMADDICVEADSGGHTDMGVASALMPAIMKLRDDMMKEFGYTKKIRVGSAGGIGTPEAAAAAFMLGADFIVTGSINQCSVEAGTSDVVKDLLEKINVQDTEYAPAGDMFEVGAKVQVLKKGVFFPARANKLYELYKQYNSIDDIDEKTKAQLQDKYFKRTFDDIYSETKEYFMQRNPAEIDKAERNPKHKMALIFRWYFSYASRVALSGDEKNKVDYQVHCGPALGAFNQWIKGTELESWRNRNVDVIADKLMNETANFMNQKFQNFTSNV